MPGMPARNRCCSCTLLLSQPSSLRFSHILSKATRYPHDHFHHCSAGLRPCCQGNTVEAMTNRLAEYDYVCKWKRKTRVLCLEALPWSPGLSLRYFNAWEDPPLATKRTGVADIRRTNMDELAPSPFILQFLLSLSFPVNHCLASD